MTNPKYRNLKAIGFYGLSLIFLTIYWYLDNSADVNELIQKADETKATWSFGFIITFGLIKYGLLILGFGMPPILTMVLIKKKKST